MHAGPCWLISLLLVLATSGRCCSLCCCKLPCALHFHGYAMPSAMPCLQDRDGEEAEKLAERGDVLDLTCTTVCPVDCIHPHDGDKGFGSARQVFIDPSSCIDCDACLDVCPVEAIYPEDELPDEMRHFAAVNRDYYRR